DAHDGAVARRAIDRDLSPEAADDAVADRQPQAGAFADVLGGEERIEHAGGDLGRHAVAGVLDLDDRAALGVGAGPYGDAVVVGATVADRVRGVDQQVDEYLGKPAIVGDHQRDRTEL